MATTMLVLGIASLLRPFLHFPLAITSKVQPSDGGIYGSSGPQLQSRGFWTWMSCHVKAISVMTYSVQADSPAKGGLQARDVH